MMWVTRWAAIAGGLMAGVAVAPTAHAAQASPAVVSVDCGLTSGVVATTITGWVGDTVTIDNTSGGEGCTFASYASVVSATNLTAGVLAAHAASTVTIEAAGTFTLTPLSTSGGGTTAVITVVIGAPRQVPQYTITFDANGGDCSSNPLVITAAAGDWFSMPAEGSGPFQCQRQDYSLAGWSFHGMVTDGGGAGIFPEPLPWQGQAADHITLYALWAPLGTELLYDANVAVADDCMTTAGLNLPLAARSTEATVQYAERSDRLATSAPCAPPSHRLVGWALSGDGPAVVPPGGLLTDLVQRVGPAASVRLFAVWTPSCNQRIAWLAPNCDLASADLVGANLAGMDLSGLNLSNVNLSGANLAGATLTGATLQFSNLTGANLTFIEAAGITLSGANLGSANLSGANLTGAMLLGANLTYANLTYTNLATADLRGVNLTGANVATANFTGANTAGAIP